MEEQCALHIATKEEKDSTRGRANVFRQVFEGENPEGFRSADLKEALQLCLSCERVKLNAQPMWIWLN